MKVKIKMTNPAKRIEGKEITINIGMMVGESIEYVPMGYYTAEKPKTDESQITVTAYDRMMKTERAFSADGIAETTDTVTVLNAISRITGVTVVTDGLTAISMQRPDSYTCREILGYISQMYGGFAICNRQGQIEIKTYIDSDYPVDTSRYWDTFEHHDVTEKIEKITCYIGKDSDTNKFKIMSDDGGIQISGATQQWKDDNGVVRMQAGRDAQGSFTFELFDETGKGVLIDSTGVQPGAIADGLIVNEMVSDTANIAASKLDIDSLFTAINDSTQVIKSNRIWLDDSGQSLNQAYTKMTQNITEIEQTAGSASDSASAAADAAKKALETLSGISTLDAMSASLNNDAHVVHTYTDGTGGDYSSCYTVFSVFLGDTDVSDHIDEIKAVASAGITGIWNPQLRKYQVTAMSTDSGCVDISALYGLEGKALLVGGKGLVIGGKTMIVKSMGSWITKRFSVSKAKDGKIGLSYDLRVSTQIIRKQKDDKTLKPANVTILAYKNDNGSVSSYSGKFQIEESKDSGKTYEIKYGSSSAELLTVYTPSSPDVQIIRCSLYDSSGVQLLDTQTVSIISDAAGLAQDIAAVDQKAQEAKEAIQTTSQEVTEIKSGMEGFETKLSKTTTDLQGVADGTLLYNTKCQDNGDGTTTVSAALYKAGIEVTKKYPAAWFSWSRRTEQGEAFLQYGYSVTVNNDDYMFGGVVIGQFIRYVQMALTVGDKILVIGNKAMCVNVDA